MPEDSIRNGTGDNAYTWGRMHGHNIIVTPISPHGYCKVNAAHTVVELLTSFLYVRFGLLVGIGAGLLSGKHDSCRRTLLQADQIDLVAAWLSTILVRLQQIALRGREAIQTLLRSFFSIHCQNFRQEHESGRFLVAEYLSKAMGRNKYWRT